MRKILYFVLIIFLFSGFASNDLECARRKKLTKNSICFASSIGLGYLTYKIHQIAKQRAHANFKPGELEELDRVSKKIFRKLKVKISQEEGLVELIEEINQLLAMQQLMVDDEFIIKCGCRISNVILFIDRLKKLISELDENKFFSIKDSMKELSNKWDGVKFKRSKLYLFAEGILGLFAISCALAPLSR